MELIAADEQATSQIYSLGQKFSSLGQTWEYFWNISIHSSNQSADF